MFQIKNLRRPTFSPHSGGQTNPAMLRIEIIKTGRTKLNEKKSVRRRRLSLTSTIENKPSWLEKDFKCGVCVQSWIQFCLRIGFQFKMIKQTTKTYFVNPMFHLLLYL